MELDDGTLVADPHLEQNLRRLQEEERVLLERQSTMEAGGGDDIAALELQDALRLNHVSPFFESTLVLKIVGFCAIFDNSN